MQPVGESLLSEPKGSGIYEVFSYKGQAGKYFQLCWPETKVSVETTELRC